MLCFLLDYFVSCYKLWLPCMQVSQMDQENVKLTALTAVFDLLHFFGLEAFKLDTAQDNKTAILEATVKDADTSDQPDDFDDLHSEASSQLSQQQETPDIGADILTILTDLLDSNVCRIFMNM